MKQIFLVTAVALLMLHEPIEAALVAESLPAITERGPHHNVWTRLIDETLPTGESRQRLSSYTELGTGLNYWSDEQRVWLPANDEIEVINGYGVARHGQHQVIFAPNINTAGAIDLQTPDGKRLRSHVLGIAWFDWKTGQSVLMAELKDSIGQLISKNQVLYVDAFTDVKADLLYTYTLAGLEQNLIFREAPPPPSSWGLSSETSRLELFTEFLDPPVPIKAEVILEAEADVLKRNTLAEPDFVDQRLNFGAMSIGFGVAFSLPQDSEGDGIPVGKLWEKRDGRDFLIERVNYRAIEPYLRTLPQAAAVAKPKGNQVAAVGRGMPIIARAAQVAGGLLPARLPVAPKGRKQGTIQLAQMKPSTKGFVLDYSALNSDTNFTFKGDGTYYLSNNTAFLSGTTTIEGGTVIKFGVNGGRIVFQGPVNCNTTPSGQPALRRGTITASERSFRARLEIRLTQLTAYVPSTSRT